MRKYPRFLALALLSLSVSSSLAEEAALSKPSAPLWLTIGGTQHSKESSYTYLGLIRPIWGGELGKGWFHSAIASWLTYQYDISINGQPDELKAKAPGIESGLGYGWVGDDYSLSLSVSAGYRNYRLSPDVPGEKPEGSTFHLSPQIQAGYRISESWDVALLSNYSIGPQSNFNRLRLGVKASPAWHVGLEGIYQEGRNYRIKQAGLFATRYLSNGLSLEVSGGHLESKDESSTPYFGVAFSKVF